MACFFGDGNAKTPATARKNGAACSDARRDVAALSATDVAGPTTLRFGERVGAAWHGIIGICM
jgi:hypothetical protein